MKNGTAGRKYRRIFLIVFTVFFVGLSAPPAFAGGQKEKVATTISMAEQPRQFIAPGNPDAIKRTLTLPFSTVTLPGTGRVIESWTFSVFDSDGKPVYTTSKEETRDRGFFKELFNIGTRPQVEIPSDLSWDGTYLIPGGSINGTLVPDGAYTYQLAITDDSGAKAQTSPFNVTVKNSPIKIDRLAIPITIFSPDGNRKTVHVDQAGSREQRWQGRFLDNSGAAVRTYTWENSGDQQALDPSPAGFDWNGRDDLGNILPDGTYTYVLSGYNRSGAVASKTFAEAIVLSVKAGAIALTEDRRIFSPNADGVPGTIIFSSAISDPAGLQTWNIAVGDSATPSTVRWTKSGNNEVPANFVFDGMDSSGKQIPDGRYQAILTVGYENGNTSKSNPIAFVLDGSPPKISLTLDNAVFGGDGKPEAVATITAQEVLSWDLSLTDKNGRELLRSRVADTESLSYTFTGKDKNGKDYPDDLYTLLIAGSDSAGNTTEVSVHARKDTRQMGAEIQLSRPILAPNKGAGGLVRITPILDVVDSIEKMGISIVDASGIDKVTKTSADMVPFWDWDGKDNRGLLLPDGSYQVVVAVVYANGTVSSARTPLSIDSSIPDIALSVGTGVSAFTPTKSNVSFALSVSPSDNIKSWKLAVKSTTGDVVRTYSGAGSAPATQVWDGRTDRADLVADGPYTATLSVDYQNGLSGLSDPSPQVRVSSAGPDITMSLSSTTFVPGNIDGPQTLTVSLTPGSGANSVSSWTLSAVDSRGKTFRAWKGNGAPPATTVWNGKSDTGVLVQSGEDYQIVFDAKDSLQLETRKSAKVTIDILVVKINDSSYKIVINSIQFAGNSSNVFQVAQGLLDKNIFVLRRLAVVLNRFPDYRIRLEGYAVSEFWDDPKTAEWEQRTQLLPLSTDRATEVRNALVLLGVDGPRFTVKGFGADRPIVANSDLEQRWQNRRVEFYLDKNP